MAVSGEPESAAFSPRRVWWAVIVFCLASVVSVLDRQILILMVDPVRRDLHVDDVQVGLLQGASFAIFYTVMGLPLGLAADRWSRRRLIVFGISAWSLATICGGFATSFGSMLAARIGVGFGEATLSPAVLSMLSDMAPHPARPPDRHLPHGPGRRQRIVGNACRGDFWGLGRAASSVSFHPWRILHYGGRPFSFPGCSDTPSCC